MPHDRRAMRRLPLLDNHFPTTYSMSRQDRFLLSPSRASSDMPTAKNQEAMFVVRDGKKSVTLKREVVNGVVVWTMPDDKSRELNRRFRQLVERSPASSRLR